MIRLEHIQAIHMGFKGKEFNWNVVLGQHVVLSHFRIVTQNNSTWAFVRYCIHFIGSVYNSVKISNSFQNANTSDCSHNLEAKRKSVVSNYLDHPK